MFRTVHFWFALHFSDKAEYSYILQIWYIFKRIRLKKTIGLLSQNRVNVNRFFFWTYWFVPKYVRTSDLTIRKLRDGANKSGQSGNRKRCHFSWLPSCNLVSTNDVLHWFHPTDLDYWSHIRWIIYNNVIQNVLPDPIPYSRCIDPVSSHFLCSWERLATGLQKVTNWIINASNALKHVL